ncbi:MAG: hypothetical protein WD230_10195 [Cucumibacter sp.]
MGKQGLPLAFETESGDDPQTNHLDSIDESGPGGHQERRQIQAMLAAAFDMTGATHIRGAA